MSDEVFMLLENLSATSSRLEKERLLMEYQKNELVQKVFKLAYDPYINFWIKAIPPKTDREVSESLTSAIEKLDVIINRELTGHDAINFLSNLLGSVTDYNYDVLCGIIKKDFDCGVSVKTINKIWPNLIPEFAVMKCHDSIEFIKFPAIGQTKMDGARTHITCVDDQTGEYIAQSSSGRILNLGSEFCEYVKKFMKTDEIFDGELVCYQNSKPIERRISNGIITKTMKGKPSQSELNSIHFIVWDIVDKTSKITYRQRFETLIKRFDGVAATDRIKSIDYKIIHNDDEAILYYQNKIASGAEGAIIKNFDGLWQCKRVKHQGKMKGELECELEIASHIPHKKDPSLIGALICKTSCGKGIFTVGSGLTDEYRVKKIDELIGQIITVRYNQLVGNGKTDEYSLYLPRIIEFRSDKDIADTLERIINL